MKILKNKIEEEKAENHTTVKKPHTVKPFEFLATASENEAAEKQKCTEENEKDSESFRIALP